MKKIIALISLLSLSLAAFAGSQSGKVPAEFDPQYFPNHSENISLFPDWPFYKPAGIPKGSEVHVSNDPNFSTYTQGKFWSAVVDWNYQLVNVNGFDMPTNWQAWPTYRIDSDILNNYTHIRMADGSTPIDPEPEPQPDPVPPVEPEPEPEPPVVPEPEPVDPEIPAERPSKQALLGVLTRLENLIGSDNPASAFSTARGMMADREILQQRIDAIRQLIDENY